MPYPNGQLTPEELQMMMQNAQPGDPMYGQVLDSGNPMQQRRSASLERGGNRFTPASGMESGSQSGLVRPTLSPEELEAMSRSFSGEEGKIASQRAMAQQMRGQGMPQGRDVGPMGVYQAPNWGESLEGVANILGGAWMGRQANKADTALDADRADQQRMKLQYADDQEQYKDQYQRSRDEVADALAQEELGLSKATLAAKAEANRIAARGDWAAMPVHMPEEYGGGTGTLVYNKTLGQWRVGDKSGEVVPSEIAKRILDYTAPTTTGSLPASMQANAEERGVLSQVLTSSGAEIERLASEGQDTSGLRGIVVDTLPPLLKGPVEDWLYTGDEQKQRAVNTYVDAQVIKAINKGVATEGDVSRLYGLRLGIGGLNPEQQLYRISAINGILSKYGMQLDLSGGIEAATDAAAPVTITSQEEFDKLDPGSFFIEDGMTYQKPLKKKR